MSHAQALASLDSAKFSWFHVKATLVSGTGFFTDAYDLFIINLAMPMIAYVYFDNQMPSTADGAVKSAAAWGTLIGQLAFGYLADKIGRKKMYGSELMVIIVATFCSALACNTVRGLGVLPMLAFWRFILGIGIGGDYPLSAVITSEFATVNRRGQMIAAVFAMQGVGILSAALIAVVTLAAFKDLILQDPLYIDYVWRICLGFGAIPATATIYFRFTMAESPRYTAHVLQDEEQARNDVTRTLGTGPVPASSSSTEALVGSSHDLPALYSPSAGPISPRDALMKPSAPPRAASERSWADFKRHFSQWKNLRILLGCSVSWFLLDVCFYGLNLNQSTVLEAIGFGDHGKNATPFDSLWSKALGNLAISSLGTVPGYWVTVFTIEKLGRKFIQFMGFAVLSVTLLILSVFFDSILDTSIVLFVAIYTVMQFFFNFGPNTTTFVIPGESFPTRYRSTCHGISAASGKLGAIIAAQAFPPLKDAVGVRVLFGIFAVFMALGLVSTSWIDETKGKTLEELAGEDEPHPEMSKT